MVLSARTRAFWQAYAAVTSHHTLYHTQPWSSLSPRASAFIIIAVEFQTSNHGRPEAPARRSSDAPRAKALVDRRRLAGDCRRCRRLLSTQDVRANDVVHALSGGTALHAGVSHRAVVKLLIEDFAPTSMQEGATGRRRSDACEAGDLEIARELLDTYGADPHAEDRDGHTALDLAREHGHDKVAALVEDRGGLPGLKKSVARPDKDRTLGGVEATPLDGNARDRLYTAPRAVASTQSREVAAVARRIGGDRRPDPAAARACARAARPCRSSRASARRARTARRLPPRSRQRTA